METNFFPRRCRPVLLAAIFGSVALFSGGVHAQNLLQDGGFELGLTTGPGNRYSASAYGAWSKSGIVYLIGMPFGNTATYEGNEAVELYSAVNPAYRGAVYQSMPTSAGTSYRVSLAVSWGNAQVVVTTSGVTNLVAEVISPGTSLPITWVSNSYTFTATGPITTITVLGESSSGYSPTVDDVRVVALPLINDGGFELGLTAGPGTYASRTTYGAWSAVGSPTTFLFGMPFGVTPAYAGQEAMLIGNGGNAGFVTQPLSTAIGQKYWVSFALNVADAGNGTARVMASTPSQTNLNQTLVAPGSSQWGVGNYAFVASGTTTTLRIQNVSGACIIDDVRVSTIPLDMALKFDGVNDYASLSTLGNRLPTTEVTVEFWQRVRSVKPQATFALSVDNGANRFAAFVPYSDGTIYWDLGNINTGAGRLSYKPPVSIVGNWQHFALVSSTVGNYMRIYRNGVLEAQKTGHSTFTHVANDLHLGRSGPGYFDGDLDEFRIWNAARSEAQIRASLNSRLTGSEAGLVAYHRMDEESGSLTLLDATANGNNGSLFNGPQRVASTVPVCGLASQTNSHNPATITWIYEGYQAGGISLADTDGYLNVGLLVSNLCGNITPASGTSGVELNSYYSGDNLTLNYLGGSWTNFTTSADGLRVRSKGDNGYTVASADATAGLVAGTATASSSGTIITSGDNAAGIHTISLGGAGGVGENSAVLNGEHGGGGGRGVSSSVNSSSTIVTSGDKSAGIYAVSQGGAGGKGGNSSVASGAYGGVGGNAGIASVSGSGTISTIGAYSMGVLALSQAGQGGNGGSGTIGNGGSGNYGGDGGAAKVDGNWTITTTGSNAAGILARSLGGAGGTAGDGSWASLTSGGSGGGSGSGSSATVNFGASGSINTYGRDAHGILAQSVGGFAGGGGDSGLLVGSAGSGGSAGDGGNVAVTNQGAITTRGLGANAIFAESVGGGGGSGGSGGLFTGAGAPQAGGDAGNVSVNNQGQIITSNSFSRGIFAQSVGGSGGNGSADLGLFYSVGGAGGKGGNGDTVTVVNSGSIITKGTNASGIFAQSVGGGGGAGGGSANVGAFGSVSVGGSGGQGGDGAVVNVSSTLQGSVNTAGDNAHGIFAQSVGGGGGSGGFAIAASGGLGISGSVGIGGKGATGGDGSNVVVTSSSGITTAGTNAHGIFAQSVGGGGGSGGFSVTLAGSDTAAVSLSLGGNAAKGGNGQSVTVNQANTVNTIQTKGEHSYGILAQSVGGGGGDGGFSIAGALAGSGAVPLSFGGSGGGGGLGGNVTVFNATAIFTEGKDAHGIFAQSVGGGGGSGGFSISGGISGGGSVGAAFGGSGGGGASAGNVAVTHQLRSINTSNDHSYGILAQSIGGGGGDGGFSVAGSISGSAAVNFAMGGSGGAGGGAGNVNVNTLLGSITTASTNSHAIFAQSVGGGGGSGGFSVAGGISGGPSVSVGIGGGAGSGASASNVTVNLAATSLRTSGERSYGILAQSVGGGGGDGGFSVAGNIGSGPSVSFAMGGAGGAGGVAGNVLVNLSGTSITTSNRNSHAIFAQSVGGGGGSGGFSVGAGISSSAAISAGIGGRGGSGANASNVTLNTTGGTINTTGDRSYGVLAQSVGGGGGDGGFSVGGGISSAPAVNFAMGGSGGVAGHGGTVAVTNRSVITTRGEDSHGIFAQSVGGGGGSGGFSVAGGISASGAAISASIGGGGTNGGMAGNVILTNSGAITTSGDHSYGILAQSVGGGGGDGGFSVAGAISQGPAITVGIGGGAGPGGKGAVVDLANSGNIYTGGELAYGLFAQSVGGGGGSGGFGVAGSLSANSGGLAFGLGGSAGSGADANRVLLFNAGNITTTNKGSHAIMAQSVGGGGGAGGFGGALVGGFGNGANLSVGVGGKGGLGGNASNVVVQSTGSAITTRDVASYGIFAQSVGGGGGDGGAGLAASLGSQSKSVNLALGIGRSGGSGGIGGEVAVNSSSAIQTEGLVSHGIVAQSIGGGGGNGGFSVAGSLSTSTNAKQLSVSVGGSGGGGGRAGNVGVTNFGQITTWSSVTGAVPDFGTNLVSANKADIPMGSVGILAQSIGGGGGNGGSAFSGTFAGTGSKNVSVAIGGGGGDGNTAGNVAVQNSGLVETWGDNSHGIVAQSIGGGGGNGGTAVALALSTGGTSNTYSVNVSGALGGGGGDGGLGGAVQVVNNSNLFTHGGSAHGIFAQSVGGGGGSGGSSVAITGGWNPNETNTVNASIAVGGAGGNGNDGGDVEVINNGTIETTGQASYGITAQSIGGGGGMGGTAKAMTVALDPDDWIPNSDFFDGMEKTLNLAIGGDGGGASDGGLVAVTNVGNIVTRGHDAYGIFAQSVGGGGGVGGAAEHDLPLKFLGDAENVAEIILDAYDALDFFDSLQIALGGSGGSAGSGGAAIVNNTGTIETFGDGSDGIFAQSVGGGGGLGGRGASGIAGKVGVGGAGGSTGDGGLVAVSQDGDITTHGINAHAITAQSIGGGGGMGGRVDRGLDDLDIGLGFGYGNGGGNGGNGGDVIVASAGQITTSNTASYGIFAQSVGGGGGVAGGVGIGPGFAGSTGGFGAAGAVSVDHAGDITTYGDASHGIFAQSAGGTNGITNAVSYVGTGGTVDITVTGDVTARGSNAHGIFAQSIGADGAGDITINILGGGTVHGGSGDSAGVRIEGGANNTLTNHGIITTLNGASGVAIRGGSGNEHVENFGTLIGQVLLGGGVNSWINRPGSVFTVETTFDLGSGNTFDNSGLLTGAGQIVGNVVSGGAIAPGNSPGSLSIDGTLTLLAEANVTFDIGGTQAGVTHDILNVTGLASLLGRLDLLLTDNFQPALTDSFTLMTFGSSSGGFTNVQGGRVLVRDNLGSFRISYDTASLVVDDFLWDTDKDGMSDQNEILAGTDWLNSGSVLAINSLTRDASGHVVLRFPRAAGRHYAMQYTRDPHSGVWNDVGWAAFTFPDATTAEWIDDGTQTGGLDGPGTFYRVKLQVTLPTEVGLGATIRRTANGHMALRFPGASGNHYAVDYTGDLGNTWNAVPSPVISFPEPAVGEWIDDGTHTGGLGGASRFYRIRLLASSPPNTPPVTWIRRNASGHAVLLFAGLPGNGHVVEFTSDLGSGAWTPLVSAELTFPGPGLCQWVDDGSLTGGVGDPFRFYRVRQQGE